jgi:hypothetical protein
LVEINAFKFNGLGWGGDSGVMAAR